MRHNVQKSRLGRTSAHRDAMLRNMVTSLLEKERIQTTVAKAKELRRVADRMITLGKRGDLHAMRLAMRVIRKKSVASKLFKEMAIQYAERNGGYTRILRLGNRPGDNAEMAIIELVGRTPPKKEKKDKKASGGKKSPVAAAREAVAGKAPGKGPRAKAAAKPAAGEPEEKPARKASKAASKKDKGAKEE